MNVCRRGNKNKGGGTVEREREKQKGKGQESIPTCGQLGSRKKQFVEKKGKEELFISFFLLLLLSPFPRRTLFHRIECRRNLFVASSAFVG